MTFGGAFCFTDFFSGYIKPCYSAVNPAEYVVTRKIKSAKVSFIVCFLRTVYVLCLVFILVKFIHEVNEEERGMGRKGLLLLVVLTLVLAFGNFVSAEATENLDNQLIELTREAADVQLSLSEGGYTYNEVKKELTPYFTENFIDQFITINMMRESDGLYYVMGTDFPIYYIPFFRYEGETWVIADNNLAAVYEFFPASTDGPVGYDNHYEAVVFILENEVWKVNEIIPQFDPNQFESATKEDVSTIKDIEQTVQSNEGEENDEREATFTEKGIRILRMIKTFFTSLFGIIFMKN